jgi:hypothetical protein
MPNQGYALPTGLTFALNCDMIWQDDMAGE